MKTIPLLFCCSVLVMAAGCKSTLSESMPASDYQATVPEKLSEQLVTLNNEPHQSFRGKTLKFHYDESKGLLTLVNRLRGSRWQWEINKSDADAQTKAFACNTYINAVRAGLGVRQWFTGAGGLVTETYSYEDCQ